MIFGTYKDRGMGFCEHPITGWLVENSKDRGRIDHLLPDGTVNLYCEDRYTLRSVSVMREVEGEGYSEGKLSLAFRNLHRNENGLWDDERFINKDGKLTRNINEAATPKTKFSYVVIDDWKMKLFFGIPDGEFGLGIVYPNKATRMLSLPCFLVETRVFRRWEKLESVVVSFSADDLSCIAYCLDKFVIIDL